MKQFKSETLMEVLHTQTLPNGLKCYIIPKKGFVEKHAMLAVNFGSADLDFQIAGKQLSTPQGIAHFLEHKIFEDPRLEYFDEFTKLSASVNAYTNFNNTVYYFSCTENFEKCLKLLFDMVLNLYLTDETVEKEKGIITQEISMYDDDPSWRVYFNMLQGLYEKNPIRNEIAGTSHSIEEIDKELLRKCFNTFYTPANMSLICAGDFDMEEIIKISQEKTKDLNPLEIKRIYPTESPKAFKPSVNDKMSVSKPLFCLGWKDLGENTPLDDLIHTKILLDIIAGGSSEVFNRLYKEALLDNSFSMDYSNGDYYSITIFSGASNSIDKVCTELKKAANLIKENGVETATFSRIKKKHMGRYVKSFNSVSAIASMQAEFCRRGFNILDLEKALSNASIENLQKRAAEIFNDNNLCLSVVDKL